MSRVVRSSHHGTVPIPGGRNPLETYIYCPVCHMEYPQSQTQSHIMRHTVQKVVYASRKEDQVGQSTVHSRNTFSYPMVQPLEFSTTNLAPVHKKDILKFQREQKNKRAPRVIQMVDVATQTSNKPLLQYKTEQTDIYNCFDSVFNGGGFQKKDVYGNNVGLASKRHLNEWESERISRK